MTISQRIFLLLKQRKLSQKQLSEYTNISPSAISSWKSKGTNPAADHIMKISEFFNVSPEYLLTGRTNTTACNHLIKDAASGYQTISQDALDKELLSLFHTLSDTDKGRVLGFTENLATKLPSME